MRVFVFIVMTFISAAMLAGCSTVEGVHDYQGALHLGCTPVPSGVICAGDRG
jgi:hypothetical protein